jgi:hypothetical protein
MITHFIKIAKRLQELHSFNSLMAIIVALKSAPIHRLRKTWTQHVSKKELNFFERISDLILDTSENKRRFRDMHMNCRLPCIPFLGLFLTDLIHIDIAHPHNSFDNPQRRNQMNNICRLISEYQQSDYKDTSLLNCSCSFDNQCGALYNKNQVITCNYIGNSQEEVCSSINCNCSIHHGKTYGGGLIKNDGTIFINEIKYVKNYLMSFLYIEELQKFKEEELYQESLELEPENISFNLNENIVFSETPNNKLLSSTHYQINKNLTTINLLAVTTEEEKGDGLLNLGHKKSISLANNQINNEDSSKKSENNKKNMKTDNTSIEKNENLGEHLEDCSSIKHHPLDDSVVDQNLFIFSNKSALNNHSSIELVNKKLTKYQEKLIFNSVNLDDPPVLFYELLKIYMGVRTNDENKQRNATPSKILSLKKKLNCYSRKNTKDGSVEEKNNLSENIQINEKIGDIAKYSLNTVNPNNTESFSDINPILFRKDSFVNQKHYDTILDFNVKDPFFFKETPIKRKCVMKSFQKTRFSQWKSYWMQLVGGNLLIFYEAKKVLFYSNRYKNNSCITSTLSEISTNNDSDTTNVNKSKNKSFSPPKLNVHIQNYGDSEKCYYQKNPCKIHQISNWMIVNLFDYNEKYSYNDNNVHNSMKTKYDIQLNDLNNGNMYKYRFCNFNQAKDWFEHLKEASTFLERKKLENLIKFD